MKSNKVLFSVSMDKDLVDSLSKKVKDIGYGATKSGYVSQLIRKDLGIE